ncbi:S-layer homology domain-containing protein [Planococcus ruber]|uniref:S-layer homology domain-containing protein n=1 Tax=Planococcus ruber TaxID=2027871 RepID=UPI001FF00DFA|nr:S-layer homology domain-containing protein [Planococcus ruber]MCJ1908261.1 S-layer homology domain-containing protein [Planococcus ruber]
MSKNKNTKMFLAGTMALSSVIAVGIPAGTADAATEVPTDAQIAAKIAADYEALNKDQKAILEIAQKEVAKQTGIFIDANYTSKDRLVQNLNTLISPLSSTELEDVEAAALTRITNFKNSARSYLKDDLQVQEVFAYAELVRTSLYEGALNSTITDLDPLYSRALTFFQNNAAPASIKNIVVKPSAGQLATIVSNIEKAVADLNAPPVVTPPGNGGGGGGGTTPTEPTEPPTTTPGGAVEVTPDTLKNNPEDVIKAIQEAASVKELAVDVKPGEAVSIPLAVASALEIKNADAVIVIASSEASYELPVSVIDGAALAKELGVASSELSITVELTKIANQLTKEKSIGFAIEFSIKAVAKDGKSIDITYLGYPVLRSIETPTALNAATSVGVRVNQDGSFTAVPTYIDGKTAKLYFSANSAYTVIQNSKTFKDIDNRGYWAEEYIEKLASKMIVSGKSADSFSPSTSITRGEFAAVLARGLGLVAEDVNSADFTDVSPTQAVNRNGEIAAVVEAGIVSGYGNGKFGPYNEITRNEAAIMISKAMDYIGSEDVKLDTTKKVSSFADYRYISPAARPHVERVLQASYLSGFKDNTFRSQNETTRAETSRILYNFLNSIKFIN